MKSPNNNTPNSKIYDCQCRSCPLWFCSTYKHSAYCPDCAIDVLVIAMPSTAFPFTQPAQVAGFGAALDALMPMFVPEGTPRLMQIALAGLLGVAALVILGAWGL